MLAIEPEISNVVRSPAAARRLLDELRSPRLRVVIDPANLFDAGDPSRQVANSEAVLTEAFELLAGDIVLAHAKDVTEHGAFAAAGQGDVDWERYLTLLAGGGYTGGLVMHGLDEADVAGSTAFLGGLWRPAHDVGFFPDISCVSWRAQRPRRPLERAPVVPVHAEPPAAVWERTGSRPGGLTAEEVEQRRGTAAVRTEGSQAGRSWRRSSSRSPSRSCFC